MRKDRKNWKKGVCLLTASMMMCSVMTGCGSRGSGSSADTSISESEAGCTSSYAPSDGATAADSGGWEAKGYYDYETESPFADYGYETANTEEYSEIVENGFLPVSLNPLSTFSADVDTASYSNLRRMIEDGYSLDEIPEGSVRIEELLNYFHYDYTNPKNGEPFGVTTQITDCPWNENSKVAMIGLKTKRY